MEPKINLLLDALPELARRALASRLAPAELRQHQLLFEAGEVVTKLYFPIDAVVSLAMPLACGGKMEAVITGRDGVVGAAAALNGRVPSKRAIVQIGGQSLACDVEDFRAVVHEHTAVRSLIDSHQQALFAQARQAAACNVTHHLESRLARWLLRAAALHGSDDLELAEDRIAEMLGALCTSVTIVSRTLQQAGAIKYTRGRIKITDALALRDLACKCYAPVEPCYDAILYPKVIDLRTRDAKLGRLFGRSTPSLVSSLDVLVRAAIEHSEGEARAAFYIADDMGTKLHHVVGMSQSYARRVDGFAISPESLACGLAAATHLPVITPDVVQEPRWKPWLSLAREAGYRACWSFPIETPARKILGTFAMYYEEPREATPSDLDLAIALSRAAADIISRH
jgi:CRP-like cAMP-binding protein